MKSMLLGMGLLAGGWLAVSAARGAGEANQGGGPTDEPATAQASERKIKLQTTCPVMGGAIDRNQYVDHDGKRVYICCKGCEAPLKKDPAKYIKKLEDEGITVARVQTTCPVMGGKVNKDLYVDHDGKRIYVCCQGCIPTIKEDPAKYIKTMEAAGVALDSANQAAKTK